MGGAIEKIKMLVAKKCWLTLSIYWYFTLNWGSKNIPEFPPPSESATVEQRLPALCSYAGNYMKEDKIKVKYGYNWTTESSCSFEDRFIEILVMDLTWVWLHASSWRKSDTQTISDQAKLGQIHFKVSPTNQFVISNRLDISNHEIMLQKVHRDQTELACPTK